MARDDRGASARALRPRLLSRMRPRMLISTSLVLVLAAASLAWLLPSAVAFLPGAPALFWAMAALALLVDLPLFFDQGDNLQSPASLSVCVCFAIFLLWGAGPAVVVQVVAAVVTAVGQRYFVTGAAYLLARLVVAFAATDLVALLVWGPPTITQGAPVTGAEIVEFL